MKSRRIVLIALVAATALWFLAPAGRANCDNRLADTPRITTLDGTVKSVSVEPRTLVLTTGSGDEAKDVTMKVCPKAKILVGGKEASLADVKAGAKAKVCHVKTDSGDLIAVRIEVGAAPCPKE